VHALEQNGLEGRKLVELAEEVLTPLGRLDWDWTEAQEAQQIRRRRKK